MSSSSIMIDCTNCGKRGWIDDDYKQGVKITSCMYCDYRLEEKYDVNIYEVYERKETGKETNKE